MGENLDAKGRHAVRSPMQWTGDANGGFSSIDASDLPTPIVEGRFGPEHVNVENQRRDPDSLLNFMTLLIQRYRECPELGWGRFEVLDQPHRSVLAHRCTWEDATLLALHNLGSEPCTVPLDLGRLEPGDRLADLLRDEITELPESGQIELVLEGFGYRWLRVLHEGDRRLV